MRQRCVGRLLGCAGAVIWATATGLAHPLGNFSIDHYSRLHVTREDVALRYVIDMAEIPTLQELLDADADRDQRISDAERQVYLDRVARALVSRLTATVNGAPLIWQIARSELAAPSVTAPAAQTSGPPTLRIVLDLQAPFPASLAAENTVRFADANYDARTGWKEIVVNSDDDVRIVRSSAASLDLSRELTRYPPETVAPPQDLAAEFTFAAKPGWARLASRLPRRELYLSLMVLAAASSLVIRWRANRRS